ncbi:MAG: ACT domain-containing protein [Syntrophomonadaceae bacterium]|jgi:hypothetical protein|nr:ACT domain-containing protein [Syntrophomonadaceae bacterium]
MTIDQISIFVENGPGRLAAITEIIADAGVDICAMSIADTTDFGILRIIVEQPKRVEELLRSNGYVVSVTQVLAVSIEDKPGSLSRVLRIISNAAISIEYIYAFITRKKDNAYVVFRVEDNQRTAEILAENNIYAAADINEILQ